MGSSGAGKTSLLNIVAGRTNSPLEVSGSVKANGIDINKLDFTKLSAFVTQEDVMLPFLTIRETLTYAALLRLPISIEEVKKKVDNLLFELRLERIADNMIGNVLYKGISGGEKKRVSIALELLSEPQIIILDEPTSGLDSFTAELLVDMLVYFAKKGKTVLATIHQPSTSIFQKFHKLILLSEGYNIYQGPCSQSRKYLNKIGYRCPKHVNPPDYYMWLLHVTNRYAMTTEESEKLEILKDHYLKTETDIFKNRIEHDLTQLKFKTVSRVDKWFILVRRSFRNKLRDPALTTIKLAYTSVVSLLAVLVFPRVTDDYKSIQNTLGALWYIALNSIMEGNGGAALDFPSERGTFLKESKQGLYHTLDYFIAKNLAEFPFQMAAITTYVCILYFPLGLNMTFAKFMTFYLIIFLCQLIGYGFGYTIGAFCPTEQIASMVSPMILSPLTGFGGFIVNSARINIAFRWVVHISPFYYAFKGLAINQYTDFDFNCGIYASECKPLHYLHFYGSVFEDIGFMIMYVFIIRIVAYFILRFVRNKF